MEKGLLNEKLLIDREYDNSEYKSYFVTKDGIKWIQNNKNILSVKEENKTNDISYDTFDDDIPF